MQKFKNDTRVRLFQVPRAGVFAGWNECLRRARGDFLWIATSDDTASPCFLENLLKPLLRFPEIRIAACDFQVIDQYSKPVDTSNMAQYKREFFGNWMNRAAIWDGKTEFLLHTAFGTTWTTMAAILFHRSLLSRAGCFRTDMGAMGDFDWSLRASLASSTAFVPGRHVTWRIYEEQCTGTREMTVQEARGLLHSIERAIQDDGSGFPPEWKQVDGWRDVLLEKARWDYYHSFQLYRDVIKKSPVQFCRNAWNTLRSEPGFFAYQSAHRFKWSSKFSPDPIDHARKYLELFRAPWPPQEIPGGW